MIAAGVFDMPSYVQHSYLGLVVEQPKAFTEAHHLRG